MSWGQRVGGRLLWFRLKATSGFLQLLGETALLPEMGTFGVFGATRNLVFYRNPKDGLSSASDSTLLASHAGSLGFDPMHNIKVLAQSVVLALWRWRQQKFKVIHSYLDEFKVILGYLRQNRPLWFPLWAPVSFNPRILEIILLGAPWGLCTYSQNSFIG